MNTQTISAKIINECATKKISLAYILQTYNSYKDISLIKAICYGTCRNYYALDYILQQILKKPLPSKQVLLKHLLLVGIFQLKEMRIPQHAAINQTVIACRMLGFTYASGLANAILRKYQRNKDKLNSTLNDNVTALYSHPQWYIDYVKLKYADCWQDILTSNNNHPPISLRINQQKTTTKKLKDIFLDEYQIDLLDSPIAYGVITNTSLDLTRIEEFKQGLFSFQDIAAQLAAILLDPAEDSLILDACAAPGGKACHLLEIQPSIKLTAIEKNQKRAEKIVLNSRRLGVNIDLTCCDILETSKWWNGKKFDKILVDAPCSATGIIKRQPDIKIIRTLEEVNTCSMLQLKILESVWKLLKPNGQLLYTTCSIMQEENQDVIEKFLKKHDGAIHENITLPVGKKLSFGWHTIATGFMMDNFYYAMLNRSST